MEPITALTLAFQLLALCSIAGALLLYLLCKVRKTQAHLSEQQIGTVLVTSADSALGLQLCIHLANKGCRIFAGVKDPIDSVPAKLLKNWIKLKENDEVTQGSIFPLRFDVTREDILRQATDAIGSHLNADERGINAVINTSGSIFRGRIENQDVQQWESMIKTNILGSLRIAKAFIGLLRPTRGRIIYLGAGNGGDELVAFNASRVAVEKCAEELRKEFQLVGIDVIALDTNGIPVDSLFRPPTPLITADCNCTPTQYSAEVLTSSALNSIGHALWDVRPYERYHLAVPKNKYNITLPCRSSFRLRMETGTIQKV